MSERLQLNDQQLEWVERAIRDELSPTERSAFESQLAASPALVEAYEDALAARRFFAPAPRPTAPASLARSIWAEIDRRDAIGERDEDLGWWHRLRRGWAWPQLARVAVPLAAVAVLVIAVLRPGDVSRDLPADGVVQRDVDGKPCELDLDEIFRSLGIERSEHASLDEKTICDAAAELKVAMAMLNRAMNRTGKVIQNETTGRLSESVNAGLQRGLGPVGGDEDASPQNGG